MRWKILRRNHETFKSAKVPWSEEGLGRENALQPKQPPVEVAKVELLAPFSSSPGLLVSTIRMQSPIGKLPTPQPSKVPGFLLWWKQHHRFSLCGVFLISISTPRLNLWIRGSQSAATWGQAALGCTASPHEWKPWSPGGRPCIPHLIRRSCTLSKCTESGPSVSHFVSVIGSPGEGNSRLCNWTRCNCPKPAMAENGCPDVRYVTLGSAHHEVKFRNWLDLVICQCEVNVHIQRMIFTNGPSTNYKHDRLDSLFLFIISKYQTIQNINVSDLTSCRLSLSLSR